MVRSLAIASDDSKLFSGSMDCSIMIWDLQSFATVGKLLGHSGWVRSLSVTPDGLTLYSGSADRSIRVWDLTKLKRVAVFNGH